MKYFTTGEAFEDKVEAEREVILSKVYVDDVMVLTRLRPLDEDRVVALAASMDAIGLQQPISVCGGDEGGVVLVAGYHRLRAAQRLGWEEIPAIYLHLNDTDRQLWEIDDNLQQANLTQTQEAEHLKRRGDLWEARNKPPLWSEPLTADRGSRLD